MGGVGENSRQRAQRGGMCQSWAPGVHREPLGTRGAGASAALENVGRKYHQPALSSGERLAGSVCLRHGGLGGASYSPHHGSQIPVPTLLSCAQGERKLAGSVGRNLAPHPPHPVPHSRSSLSPDALSPFFP